MDLGRDREALEDDHGREMADRRHDAVEELDPEDDRLVLILVGHVADRLEPLHPDEDRNPDGGLVHEGPDPHERALAPAAGFEFVRVDHVGRDRGAERHRAAVRSADDRGEHDPELPGALVVVVGRRVHGSREQHRDRPGPVLADLPRHAHPDRNRDDRAREIREHHERHDLTRLDHVLRDVEGERSDEAPADQRDQVGEHQHHEGAVPERHPQPLEEGEVARPRRLGPLAHAREGDEDQQAGKPAEHECHAGVASRRPAGRLRKGPGREHSHRRPEQVETLPQPEQARALVIVSRQLHPERDVRDPEDRPEREEDEVTEHQVREEARRREARARRPREVEDDPERDGGHQEVGAPPSPARSRAVGDVPHHRVGDGVPQAPGHQHPAEHPGRESQLVGVVVGEIDGHAEQHHGRSEGGQ